MPAVVTVTAVMSPEPSVSTVASAPEPEPPVRSTARPVWEAVNGVDVVNVSPVAIPPVS